MYLIIENQVIPGVYRHLDHVCDLCRQRKEPDELIAIYISSQQTSSSTSTKQQLIACRHCLSKLQKTILHYLGNLIVGADVPERVEL